MPQKRKDKRNAEGVTPNFPALQLLSDPQTFGEKLYDYLNRYGQWYGGLSGPRLICRMLDKRLSLDHKILIMQLLSRVMGAHQLCVLGFYTYIIK